jgi:hypothetical protein
VTPHPPPQRFTDRDVIARAAARLADEDNPVLVEVSLWLADVVRDWDVIDVKERSYAVNVATAALREPATVREENRFAADDEVWVDVQDGAG